VDKRASSIPEKTEQETQNITQNQTKPQLKKTILETVKKEKPQNTQQLIHFMQQRYGIQPEETAKLLIELENENLMEFTKPQPSTPTSLRAYLNSRSAAWFWITITLATATTITVFTVPETAYPLAYVRNVLGTIFVLFLPGYTFIKMLFPQKLPIPTSSENLDNIERIALSLGMSLAIVPIIGLILNYTPWGIRLTPIVLSLFILTLVSATIAVAREHQTINVKSNMAKLETLVN
jgi:hypothetical protein